MEIILFKALQLILALSILVFIHELGHFMWARIFKVGVEKFYMFFDTEQFALLRWNKEGLFLCNVHVSDKANPSETEYGIGWIPLGGYCAIKGMVDETHSADDIEGMEGDDLFMKKGRFAQFMIMVGGVLNNMILAILIYIGMSWHWGKDVLEMEHLPNPVYSEYAQQIGFRQGDVITSVDGKEVTFGTYHNALLLGSKATVRRGGSTVDIALPDTLGQLFLRDPKALNDFLKPRFPMVLIGFNEALDPNPAQQAGLEVGDSIVGVIYDSVYVETPFVEDVQKYLAYRAGDTLTLCYLRGEIVMTSAVTVQPDSTLGVMIRNSIPAELYTHIDYNFFQAIPAGIERGWTMLYNYVKQFKLVFTKEGAQSLGGFGTMGSIFPETWNWMLFWSMTAFFSVALAFMNILPIPALDGGHIMILILEAIFRRKFSDKTKERAQYVGMAIILALMIYVNANDIWKFIVKPFLG